MNERLRPSRIRFGMYTAALGSAGLFGLYLLAGGDSSSRQDTAHRPPVGEEPPTSATGGTGTQPMADAPSTTTQAQAPPAAASPPPPRTAPRVATAPGAGSLAGAWIAAGAQGIDVNATPGPATAPGSGGPPPVTIEIPGIGVSAAVDPAGLNGDGTLQVPADFARTNYYTGRPVPGDPGPAVIVGHVDSRRGPAVFYRLRELQPGAEVTLHRADGSQVVFVVERSKQVPKNAFPTEEVYGPTPDPTLRLVTCGGSFDRRSGHYRDNFVVFLRMRP